MKKISMAKRILALSLALLTLVSLTALVSCGGGNGKSYVFKKGNVTMEIGKSADCLTQLGTPSNVESYNATCGDTAVINKLYTYPGFQVHTTPEKNGDIIFKILITDDSVKTPEGLTIGSTRAQVTSALGNGSSAGGNITYEGKGMKLQFYFRGDEVINILYEET